MFILSKISIKNFMSISEQEIEFGEGIVGITGENGSGKSSLLNAIGLCITEYRAGDSLRDYVKAGEIEARINLEGFYKGYPISYEVIINNRPYGNPLKRKVSYKGKIFENSDYSKFLKHENLENLEKVMFLFQGDTSLTSIKPFERAAALKQLFNFNFEDQVNSLNESILRVQTDRVRMNGSLDAYKSRSFEKQLLSREVNDSTINSWESDYLSINHQLSSLNNLKDDQTNLLKSEIESLEREKKKSELSIDTSERNIKDYKKEIESIRLFISENENKKIPENLEDSINTLDEKLAGLKSDLSEATDIKNIHFYKVKELKNQIEVGKKGYCHSCGQKIEETYVEGLQAQLKQEESALRGVTGKIDDLKKLINETTLEKERNESTLRDLKNIIDRVSKEKKRLEEKEHSLSVLEDSLREKRSNIDLMENQLSYLRESLKEQDSLLKKLEEKEDLLKKSKDLENKINEAKAIKTGNELKKAQNEKMEKERAECNNKIIELSKEINEADLKIKGLKSSLDVFQRDFPNFIVLRACSQLEGYVNEFVHRVFPHMDISLKQERQGVQFYYKVKGQDRELSIKMASGAQKSVLTLAYKIAEAKLYGLDCILLDECDASLNDENSSLLYKFIAEINSFKQLIFVSHRKKAIKEVYESFKGNMKCYWVDAGVYSEVDPNYM